MLPFHPISARRDDRVRDYIRPVRIVWTSHGAENAENLLTEGDAVCRFSPAQNQNEPPGIVLDFGRETHGSVRFDVPLTTTGKPVRVRVRFGESVSEAMTAPNNDHAVHNQTVLLPWMGHAEVGLTGFRFVRLDNLDTETGFDLRSAEAVQITRDIPYLGAFECSDPKLNAIWQTGAHTVHLCMQDYVWDGIKRDRLVWIGDLHPEALVVAAVFGNHPIVPETLDYQKHRTPLDAQNAGSATGGGAWMNGISSYSLWWIIIQWDWYNRSGDLTYLQKQRGYLAGLVARLEQYIGPNGEEKLDGFRFLEWPTSGDSEAVDAGLQALTTLALQSAARIFEALGDVSAETVAAQLAEKTGAVRRPTKAKQAAALAVLAQMSDAKETNAAILSRDPFRGLSTFYGFYVLLARAQSGDMQGCLDLMRTYWGAMIERGATTFWEGFEMDWLVNSGRIDEITPPGLRDLHADFGGWCYEGLRHSLCHGWAAGPTAFLSSHVLGVEPAAPGFASTTIAPQLGDLAWAKGSVPTPHGVITVQHTRRADGTVETVCDLPEGIVRVQATPSSGW